MANPGSSPLWSSDVRISIPEPMDGPVIVPMFGFGMTAMGLGHDLTQVEYEAYRTPSYSPELPVGQTVYGDEDVS